MKYDESTGVFEIPFNDFSASVSPAKSSSPKVTEYSREEVFQSSLEYFDGDELAAEVWMNKYCLKKKDGTFLERSPADMHRRLAAELHRIEAKYAEPLSEEKIFDLLDDFKYIVPQGGPMSGIGNNQQIVSLSNCFVIGQTEKADSYGAIMKTDEEQIQLMKRRGGVGHDLSGIRPAGTPVMNSAMTSTGILPFMNRFSNSTREVAQGGRRGALMLTISIQHPDVRSFIQAKQDTTKITGANISLRIDNAFMTAVRDDTDYELKYPIDSANPVYSETVKARDIWQLIVNNAWSSGEPGVLFWDTIESESVADCYADYGFKTTSTNPCGEIPLCPYDSCRLLAINLYSYVEDKFTENARFNEKLFREHCAYALRIMDDIVDLEIEKVDRILEKIESDPENFEIKQTELKLWQKVREKCIQGRRTGIGITAEGDMVAALGLKYGTPEATAQSVKVHEIMAKAIYRASVDRAKERGSFPLYDKELEKGHPFVSRILEGDDKLKKDMELFGRRNISMLTIAPTGTTSLMTRTASGIEPVFMISYMRRKKVNPDEQDVQVDFVDEVGDSWKQFRVFHPPFKHWLSVSGYDPMEVADWTDEQLHEVIMKSPYADATANDIDWREKVRMQGAVQKWVDHSISVTVNLPNDVEKELIHDLYLLGWENGCKGVTVYRDGSRSGVLVANEKKEKVDTLRNFKRPASLEADIIRFRNNKEKWVAIIGKQDGHPYEVFTGKSEDTLLIPNYVEKGWVHKIRQENGKSRYDFQFKDKDGYGVTFEGISRAFDKEYWNYAKLISGVMRHGMPIKYVVHMVANLHLNDESLSTWKNGVVRALSKYIPDGEAPEENTCPDCEQPTLEYKEGCLTCRNCGHTRCG